MKINVANIEDGPVSFDHKLSVDAERLDSEQVSGPISVHLEDEVRPHGGVFSVSGRCSAEGPLTCSRCLEPVTWSVAEDFTVEYRSPDRAPVDEESGLDADDLDVSFLVDQELDLVDLAAEQVLLALPMRIVCNADCAGLCPRCGANLNNDGDCGCEPEVDPRWGALQDFVGGTQES